MSTQKKKQTGAFESNNTPPTDSKRLAPDMRHLPYSYGVIGPLLLLWFVLIYVGADYLTGLHTFRVRLHFPCEQHMPFVPAMVLFYNSFHLIYLTAPFIMRSRPEINAIALTWGSITLCGGITFLLFPAENIFPIPTDETLGRWRSMFRLADRANLDYNMCPSLHVAWAVAGVDIFAQKVKLAGKVALWTWANCLSLSTLLVHQHYVVDVITGTALAMLATRILYPRFLEKQLRRQMHAKLNAVTAKQKP